MTAKVADWCELRAFYVAWFFLTGLYEMNKFFIDQVNAHPKTWVFSAFGAGAASFVLLKIFASGFLGMLGL